MMILIIPMKNLLMKIKVCKAFEELSTIEKLLHA